MQFLWRDSHLGVYQAPNPAEFRNSAMYALAWAVRRWVAVGATTDSRGRPSGPAAWISTDGLNWTRVARPPAAKDALSSIVGGARGFLVASAHVVFPDIGGSTTTYSSADGRNWKRRGNIPGDVIALVDDGAGYFALGSDKQGAAIWSSPDGKAWKRVPSPIEPHGAISALHVYSDGMIAAGSSWSSDPIEGFLWAFADGTNWEQLERFSSANFNDIALVDDITVIVGTNGDDVAADALVLIHEP